MQNIIWNQQRVGDEECHTGLGYKVPPGIGCMVWVKTRERMELTDSIKMKNDDMSRPPHTDAMPRALHSGDKFAPLITDRLLPLV